MQVSGHFRQRLQERFPAVVEDIGMEDVIMHIVHNVQSMDMNDVSIIHIGGDKVMFEMVFRVYENDKKYHSHKLFLVATLDFSVLITVLTLKMSLENKKKTNKKHQEIREKYSKSKRH